MGIGSDGRPFRHLQVALVEKGRLGEDRRLGARSDVLTIQWGPLPPKKAFPKILGDAAAAVNVAP